MSFLIFVTAASGAVAQNSPGPEVFRSLEPLHLFKEKPSPHDWLAVHREPGQTFQEYLALNPPRPDEEHNKIYIVLIGDFDPLREEIVHKSARYIEAFYTLPVEFMPPIVLNDVPSSARRVHPITRDPQILSTYILDEVLVPRKPADAFCLLAFTSSDLWPGLGWNFVFGQAAMPDRVGVWSVYRNGDPQESPAAYQVCLRRTISTGIHELGHMFSFAHCIFYECNMNGSNHRQESDQRPLWLCPVDLRKLCWLLGLNPLARYEKLAKISRELGLEREMQFFERSLSILHSRITGEGDPLDQQVNSNKNTKELEDESYGR